MSFPTTIPVAGQTASVPPKSSPVLKEGQMFHGQIKQLFPGQMAEVQIGNQKLVAKLEVPMKAGDSYYFQVNAVKPELQLKIISGPLQGTEGQGRQLTGLMDAMQLPKTPEMQALLSFVMQNKIPMSRENLIDAAALLKNVPVDMRNEALQSIQKLVELKLPMNENLFRAMFGVETKEGLHSLLTTLKNAMLQDVSIAPQVKAAVLSSLDNAAKPFTQATGTALLGQTFLTLLDSTESPENRFAALQLLKSTGLLPQQTSLANLQQVLVPAQINDGGGQIKTENMPLQQPFQTSVAVDSVSKTLAQPVNGQVSQQPGQQLMNLLRQLNTAPLPIKDLPYENLKAAIQADTLMNTQQKAEMNAIVDRAVASPQNSETIAKLVTDMSQMIFRQTAQAVVTSPFQNTGSAETPVERLLSLVGQQQQLPDKMTTFIKTAESSENKAVHKMMHAAEVAVSAAVDGRAMKEAMQSVFRALGFNYEAGILSSGADLSRMADTLKPQLLEMLQNHALSPMLREAAETVVMRMNGPLLQSGENGVQHQLVMQVPMEFFGKRIDTTLQWNGRMKEDGKIDPDYARILFYLDLESIEKTVIDMQVQNRVVSITVFNADDSLKLVGMPLQRKLKEGLESTGYKLSGVFFKNFEEHEQKVVKKELIQPTEGQGVDFRI